jgi:uncharacterized protein (DUF1697 family)
VAKLAQGPRGQEEELDMRRIALLRGINLGAARRVPMAGLREVLATAGYRGIRTLDQSGNVVLEASVDPDALEQELTHLLGRAFGWQIPVLVRTRDQLAEVIRRDPLGALVHDPRRYQVSFLNAEPTAHVVRELETAEVAPELVTVIGREVYSWHPNGIARSPLANLISERRLGVAVTGRNWRTLTKLLALAEDPGTT